VVAIYVLLDDADNLARKQEVCVCMGSSYMKMEIIFARPYFMMLDVFAALS
jgi:hypothetical protein